MVEGSPGKALTHKTAVAHPFEPEQENNVHRGMTHAGFESRASGGGTIVSDTNLGVRNKLIC